MRYQGITFLFVIGSIEFTQAAKLNCYNGTVSNPLITPLESPLAFIENSCIDTQRGTVFYVFGLNENTTVPSTTTIVTAYLTKGDVNLLVLDWSEEARIGKLGLALGYARAVKNAQIVGEQFAKTLLTLNDAGVNFDQVHILGHSLGAQLIGITASNIPADRGLISRMTGLDPARPLYEGVISMPNKLDSNSARFVDIVHTNPGGFGTEKSRGTVDFWPNYNDDGIQPGCSRENNQPLTTMNRCSHDRSWELFAAAAGEPDYDTWIRNNGTTDQIAYLGEYVSPQAKGNFYLVTNAQCPYGMGDAGTRPNK